MDNITKVLVMLLYNGTYGLNYPLSYLEEQKNSDVMRSWELE